MKRYTYLGDNNYYGIVIKVLVGFLSAMLGYMQVIILGFGIDTADTAFSFMHNDAVGAAVKEPIPGQPALTTANVYDAYIFCKPNDTNVYYRLDDLSAGVTIIDSVVSTDLPVATTNMTAVCGIGSGATNSGAAVASFGLNRLYIESDQWHTL